MNPIRSWPIYWCLRKQIDRISLLTLAVPNARSVAAAREELQVVVLLRSCCTCSFLSFVSAHYCKCIFKARQLWAKPQLWCDKFIFSKTCNPMLHCCCRSPALLTQAERSVDMKEHLLLKGSFWIILDYGGNSFEGSFFPVTNSILQLF